MSPKSLISDVMNFLSVIVDVFAILLSSVGRYSKKLSSRFITKSAFITGVYDINIFVAPTNIPFCLSSIAKSLSVAIGKKVILELKIFKGNPN